MWLAQILGCVFFLAIAGRIFYTTSIQILRPLLPAGTSTAFIAELIAGSSSPAFQSLSPEVAKNVIQGITHSMRNVWIFLLSAGCLSFVLTLFLSVRVPRSCRLNIILTTSWSSAKSWKFKLAKQMGSGQFRGKNIVQERTSVAFPGCVIIFDVLHILEYIPPGCVDIKMCS